MGTKWHLCKVHFIREVEEGVMKTFTEQYLIDAVNFADAEARAVKTAIAGEGDGVEVVAIARTAVTEVIWANDSSDAGLYWFKVKVVFKEETGADGKERLIPCLYMVQAERLAGSLCAPVHRLQERLRGARRAADGNRGNSPLPRRRMKEERAMWKKKQSPAGAGRSPKQRAVAALDRVFSEYVRLRDAFPTQAGLAFRCISCGRVLPYAEADCGHYVNRRHMSTRFDEDNCHAQCRACNRFDEGNIYAYRRHLVEKIGEARVLLLEQKKHAPFRWTEFELVALAADYRKRIKQLKEEKQWKRQ